ncbi:ZIP Zinc transporter protein [Rutstroemia sp. NJR-2017a BBW]|nr:ZIP Zinc transporter protein [Rutstroemia sp. NJR-2017a BBW]
MSVVSGVACVVGSCIICVDIFIRYFPSKRNFRIQDSNAFLAASLSLSFGVMIFSSLYSMLPSSKKYLVQGGYSKSEAAWILLGCFAGGFIGIQIISRLLHHYIPSHVVDCDHSHNQESHNHGAHHDDSHAHGHDGHRDHDRPRSKSKGRSKHDRVNGNAVEENGKLLPANLAPSRTEGQSSKRRASENGSRRPSMTQVQSRVMSFVKDTKTNCDQAGPCFGYSDLCGQECLRTPISSRQPVLVRSGTGNFSTRSHPFIVAEGVDGDIPEADTRLNKPSDNSECSDTDSDIEAQHHHHVPENAFMDIGLQASIAIALHKLPEGFITFATNHANPELGVSVFIALFVHNITEGFAMALPLYLALGSRPRAIFWSSILGGFSQPLGAGIAAAWFAIAGKEGHAPNIVVYGCMFGITGGIMASVALQLFVESLGLNHNRHLCIAFAFVGMALMGMSNALTSG